MMYCYVYPLSWKQVFYSFISSGRIPCVCLCMYVNPFYPAYAYAYAGSCATFSDVSTFRSIVFVRQMNSFL